MLYQLASVVVVAKTNIVIVVNYKKNLKRKQNKDKTKVLYL